MRALGYILVALGVFVYYDGAKGRTITEIFSDLGALLKGAVTFDSAAISEVIEREGTMFEAGTQGAQSGVTLGEGLAASPSVGGGKTLAQAKALGGAAKGYRLGATGPHYYDCSGLIYAAMKAAGVYTGLRFTTYTFGVQAAKVTRVIPKSAATTGDIICWRGHMGILASPTTVYHASTPKGGIKTSDRAGLEAALLKKYGAPKYYRIV